ncbi:glycosyltransferase family 2 protein [Thiolinea disciformis]|uniref:glycosyltransferase family 2 protein n=1 Tax=Thiolinea disciformis TaxID=125614 RepID=UPI00036796EE|nr:glycosyltransferase [Thiolinea disciformis]
MSSTDKPLISVIIPTYNHAQYLGRALQSVLDQTYSNWEAIVIDNHSTDHTDDVLSSFNDSRIIVLKIHNNGVIAMSRNTGINIAKGEWVAFLDSDDWWTKDKIQKCQEYLTNDFDIIYHDLKIIYEKYNVFPSKKVICRQLKKPTLIDLLENGNALATSSVIIRKKLLHRIKGMNSLKELVGAEDYNTWLRIAQITDNFKYIPTTYGYYYMHGQNISKKNMAAPIKLATKDFRYLLNQGQKNKLDSIINYNLGKYYLNYSDYENASKFFKKAFPYAQTYLKIKIVILTIYIFMLQIKQIGS